MRLNHSASNSSKARTYISPVIGVANVVYFAAVADVFLATDNGVHLPVVVLERHHGGYISSRTLDLDFDSKSQNSIIHS